MKKARALVSRLVIAAAILALLAIVDIVFNLRHPAVVFDMLRPA